MKFEREFTVTAEELSSSIPISIRYPPLIDTDTRKLGAAGWTLYYHSSYRWGNPKIRMSDPKTNMFISIKLKTKRGWDGSSLDYPCDDASDLFNLLRDAGVIIKRPRNLGFVQGNIEALEKDKLIQKQTISGDDLLNRINKNNELNTKIILLIKELSATKDRLWEIEESTVGIKAALKCEIGQLKIEVDDVKAKLLEYQNETSLDIIQRLNRESYEQHLERPFVEEEENQTERIFKSVTDLIERILSETRVTEKVT